MALLMPQELRIIAPFTKPKSFDDDDIPDGFEVLIQPLDSFKDPTKLAGTLLFELYTHRKASGDRKGQRLGVWEVPIATTGDQKRYWNRTTQMYEFELEMNTAILPPANRYVMLVTYNSPWGKRVQSECVVEMPSWKADMIEQTLE